MMNEYNDPIIEKAVGVVNSMSRDPKLREMLRMREESAHQRASLISQAERRGEKKKVLKKGDTRGKQSLLQVLENLV